MLKKATLRDVIQAEKVISKFLPRTPLVYSRSISETLGNEVYFKLENTLPTRAFKVRGMVYYVNVKQVEKGIVVASTGNFAQAAAYSANLIGKKATIVMPQGVSENKVESVKRLGGDVIFHGKLFDESLEYAEKLARDQNLNFVHSVNEPALYPGVGTMHLEVLEDLPDVDVVINPIGGGSGAGSAVIVYKSADPGIKVIGVQAEGASSVYESLKQGKIVNTGKANTLAEGIATSKTYDLAFDIMNGKIDDVVKVS
ncbi:MAG: threonine ammonia-lyase, partial [Thermoplasmata archaeon]